MKLELEIRTIEDDVNLGAEVLTDNEDANLQVILNAIKSGLTANKNWVSFIAKVYF